jgi:HTH-type transcriptional regulator/antitoxin HigA
MMKNIRPIKTEDDYAWALAEITAYFDNQPEVGSPDGDRFDVLATLIEAYEDRHYPISAPDPVSTIAAHMEMAGLKQEDLAEVFGSRSRASEVLHRKRALTLDMIYRLHKQWNIPAEILVQPYHLSGEMKPRQSRRLRA